MIEQSELAKSIRKDDKKKVDEQLELSPSHSRSPTDIHSPAEQTESDIVSQAHMRKTQLESVLAREQTSTPSDDISTTDGSDTDITVSTREMMKSIVMMIETTSDPGRLETLLTLNDDLMVLLGRLERKPPSLRLQGLSSLKSNGGAMGNGNGHTHHLPDGSSLASEDAFEATDDGDDEPITPRVDKGKARAEPEPEPVESILSPTKFLISESDDEDGGASPPPPEDPESIVTPTDLSVSLKLYYDSANNDQ